jgi:hypothetical protein
VQLEPCRDLFAAIAMDSHRNRLLSRKDLLAAFRRTPHLAESLRMPLRIRQSDGTLEHFIDAFHAMDTQRTGLVTFKQVTQP